jgi:hypothetical protein
MMKKIATSLVCPLVGALLMTSCLGGEDATELSSNVALLSFSIGDLKTTHIIKKADGTDSTYTTQISGSAIEFTIDQIKHLVYNTDSLAYNTNVKRVLVNVKADGGIYYLKPDGTAGSVEDSIDFTTPVTFCVTSYDGQFKRDYVASINVHQVDPEKTEWYKVEGTNLPTLDRLRVFVKDDCLYVVGAADGAYYTASATLTDYTNWATTECSGIEGKWIAALLVDEVFYLKTDVGLYCSEDAVTWTEAGNEAEVNALPGEGISHGVAWFCQPLKTNDGIVRTTFIATPEVVDTCAQVWLKLSTEESWTEVEPKGTNVYGCPNLENLAVIQYADKMYAFGGKSIGNRKVPLRAFSGCYESRDNGVTWKVNDTAFSLPKEFEARSEAFTTTTDGEYVWVIWSNGEVWRGRWNGIK